MKKRIIVLADHDGTLSRHDMGKDHLAEHFSLVYDFLNVDGEDHSEKFVNTVKLLRNTPEISHYFLGPIMKENGGLSIYDPEIHYGTELAQITLMESLLTENNELLQELERKMPPAMETLRDYAREMLLFPPDGVYRTVVCSAGLENCLERVYDNVRNGSADHLEIRGTRIEGVDKGKPNIYPVGRKHKGYEVQKITEISSDTHLISYGDSAGDAEMLLETYRVGGVPVSIGAGARDFATLVVSDRDEFLTAYKVGIAMIALKSQTKVPEKAYREALKEAGIEGTQSHITFGRLPLRKIDRDIYLLVKNYG